jgi:hypothetical protein
MQHIAMTAWQSARSRLCAGARSTTDYAGAVSEAPGDYGGGDDLRGQRVSRCSAGVGPRGPGRQGTDRPLRSLARQRSDGG